MGTTDWLEPAVNSDIRVRALLIARSALGVREKGCDNRGPDVDTYLLGCVRDGRHLWTSPDQLGKPGSSWCGAAVSAWVWRAWSEITGQDIAAATLAWSPANARIMGLPIGYRLRVWELVQDAMATGAWREDGAPLPGDLMVFGRGAQDPRRGGKGHVAVREEGGSDYLCIGGNERPVPDVPSELDGVHRAVWGDQDNPLVGWIVLGGYGSRSAGDDNDVR